MSGGHNMTRKEQELLGRIVVGRQQDKNLKRLPLQLRCLNKAGGATLCPECDPYFDALAREIAWEAVAHSGPDPAFFYSYTYLVVHRVINIHTQTVIKKQTYSTRHTTSSSSNGVMTR
jgi:hypothetical protein